MQALLLAAIEFAHGDNAASPRSFIASFKLACTQTSNLKAPETALASMRDEAKVGQRTTLGVLNAQQALWNARVNLVFAQHRVVPSYAGRQK